MYELLVLDSAQQHKVISRFHGHRPTLVIVQVSVMEQTVSNNPVI